MWIAGALEEFGASERFVLTIYIEIPADSTRQEATWRGKPKNLEVILYEGEDKPDEYYERIMNKLEDLCRAYDNQVIIQPNVKPFSKIIITTNRERYIRKIKAKNKGGGASGYKKHDSGRERRCKESGTVLPVGWVPHRSGSGHL